MRYKNVDNGRVIDIPSKLTDKKWVLVEEPTSIVTEATEKKKSVKKKNVKKEG